MIASALEMIMKKQTSRQTKRSRPASSKVQTNRRSAKTGSRKRSGSTALANKSNRVRQSSQTTARSDKRVRPRPNENGGRANGAHASRVDRVTPKKASSNRPEAK